MSEVTLTVEPHPLLDLGAFSAHFPAPLGSLPSPPWLVELLSPAAPTPLRPDESVRSAVRDLLRHGGYKPTGRGKPASEYLVRAASDGALRPINAAVDACNALSLHSGLPISVVDLDKAQPPFRAALAPEGARYAFNVSGQEIELDGLLCLFDAAGPCANAVKDSQRTKTDARTQSTLSVLWGAKALGQRTAQAAGWYRELLGRLGASTTPAHLAKAS